MAPRPGGVAPAGRFERNPMLRGSAAIRGRVLIQKDRCKGCELCIEFCPMDVLVRSEDFNPKGYHYPIVRNDDCINCRLCLTVCPEFAIFSVPLTGAAAAQSNQGGSACCS